MGGLALRADVEDGVAALDLFRFGGKAGGLPGAEATLDRRGAKAVIAKDERRTDARLIVRSGAE